MEKKINNVGTVIALALVVPSISGVFWVHGITVQQEVQIQKLNEDIRDIREDIVAKTQQRFTARMGERLDGFVRENSKDIARLEGRVSVQLP